MKVTGWLEVSLIGGFAKAEKRFDFVGVDMAEVESTVQSFVSGTQFGDGAPKAILIKCELHGEN